MGSKSNTRIGPIVKICDFRQETHCISDAVAGRNSYTQSVQWQYCRGLSVLACCSFH